MKRMKLTNAGRAVIFILVAAILVGCGYFAWQKFGADIEDAVVNIGTSTPSPDKVDKPSQNKPDKTDKDTDSGGNSNVINLSLDEWIG